MTHTSEPPESVGIDRRLHPRIAKYIAEFLLRGPYAKIRQVNFKRLTFYRVSSIISRIELENKRSRKFQVSQKQAKSSYAERNQNSGCHEIGWKGHQGNVWWRAGEGEAGVCLDGMLLTQMDIHL